MSNVNQDLASLFASMAGLLASRAENPYKVKAYQRAAESLRNLQEEVGCYAERGDLRTIPGIGKELAHKIQEFLSTGRMRAYEELKTPLPDSVRAEAGELLRERGVGDDESLVVVAPGARWETKRWAPKRFAEAIDGYSARVAARTVLVGSAEECSACDTITGACRPASWLCQSGPASKLALPVNLAGETTLGCVAALIERSDLVLCHDSAAMHLGVALGRPLVCIVGPTNPHRTGPYRRPQDVLRLALDCSPCYLRRLAQCDHDHRCMTDLASGVVADAVYARLSSKPTRTSGVVTPPTGNPAAPV